MAIQNPIIHNQSGKHIRCSPAVKPFYDQLLKIARSGNYWASTTVLGIKSLTSSRLGKDNIFVKPSNMMMNGIEEFYVVLPGCTATIRKFSNDDYLLAALTVDTSYFQKHAQCQKPGLHTAFHEDGWKTAPIINGKLKDEERLVAISDGAYENPKTAANSAAPRIANAPGYSSSNKFDRNGFDIHFTPGNAPLGGTVNFLTAIAPLSNTDTLTSAITLAKTMYHAKDLKGICWASELGGSAVLTQAMKILVDQGVTLPNHSAYLFQPTTLPSTTIKLAHQLNLSLDPKFMTTAAFDIIGNSGHFSLVSSRLKNEDAYKWDNALMDTLRHGTKIQGIVTLGASAAAGVAMAMGGALAAPAIPAITQIVTAAASAGGFFKIVEGMAESALPRVYQKTFGKIK